MKGFAVEKCLFLNDFHAVRNHCPEKAGMGKSLPSDGLDSLRDHDFSTYSVGVEIPQAALISDKKLHHFILILPCFFYILSKASLSGNKNRKKTKGNCLSVTV